MNDTNPPGRGKDARTVAGIAGALILAKFLGIIRSACMAAAYGTGSEATAFHTASRIPLSFSDILFSAIILGCFIPVYSGFCVRDSDPEREREGSEFVSVFFTSFLLLSGLLSVLGILFAPGLISLIAPDLPEETARLATVLLRILLPVLTLVGSTYTLVGILQSKGRFILPSLISATSNAIVILYFLVFNPMLGDRGIYGLAVTYLFSWVVQLLTLLIPLLRMRFRFRFFLSFRNEAFRKALRMMPPIVIGSWLAPVSLLIGTRFSSSLANPGAITVFEYAVNIETILSGILAYSICNFIFPRLSRLHASGDAAGFADEARRSLTAGLALTLPVMAASVILAKEGTALLYFRGAFTAADLEETANTLRILALGIPAFCLSELISRMLYASGNPRPSMIASLSGIATDLAVTALLFAFPSVTESLSVGAVAIGYLSGLVVCVAVKLAVLFRTVPGLFTKPFLMQILLLVLTAALSGAVMALLFPLVAGNTYDILHCLWVCAAVAVPGFLVYFAGIRIFRIQRSKNS